MVEWIVEECIFDVEVYGWMLARADEDSLLHRFARCLGAGFGGWAIYDLLLDIRKGRAGSRWTAEGGEIY